MKIEYDKALKGYDDDQRRVPFSSNSKTKRKYTCHSHFPPTIPTQDSQDGLPTNPEFFPGGTQPSDLSPPPESVPEIPEFEEPLEPPASGEPPVAGVSGYVPENAIPTLPPKQLSPSAVDKRLRRIMTPTSSGAVKGPQELIDQWKDLSTRPQVMSMFEKAGYDPDRGWMKLNIVFACLAQDSVGNLS